MNDKMKIISINIVLVVLLVISGCNESSSSKSITSAKSSPIKFISAGKWYVGGNLHRAGALDWQKADYHNKLATCSDFIAGLWDRGDLQPEVQNTIKTVDDIKPYAIGLVTCLDGAFAKDPNPQMNNKIFANQTVSEFSVMCMLTMGWLK